MADEKHKKTPPAGEAEEYLRCVLKFRVPAPAHLVVVELSSLPTAAEFTSAVRMYEWAPPEVGRWYADHAHREGADFFTVTYGCVEVWIHDGMCEASITLTRGESLYIPPWIWHKVRILEDGSRMVVLTDVSYDREREYLEGDFDAFCRAANERRSGGAST